jgi:hypothetical protein
MKRGILLLTSIICFVLLLAPLGSAIDPYTATVDIPPLEMEGWPILSMGNDDTIDIHITSDRDVDIYIVSMADLYTDWTAWDIQEIKNRTSAEDSYKGVTSKTISKSFDSEDQFVAIVHNPSTEETATVTIEYEFWEEVIEDEVKDAFCFGAMLLGIVGIGAIMALVFIVKRRS